ncbi:unnamed protein product [Cercospora beticola]|nr:unnamed protein product [Cercospora beticola]
MARRKRTPPRADRNAYKSATDRVINFLVAAAGRNGPITTHLQENGRAKVDHLPDLAEAVSDDVEDRIFDDIRIAIDGREADLHYHIVQGDSTEEDIARHQHMVSMLRQVRTILYAHRRPRIARQPDKANTKQAQSGKDARQQFSRLQVCEPSASPLGQAPSTDASFSSGDRAAAFNLLQQFQEVENHVLGLWRSLPEGEGSLLTCGVLSNAAYLLMRDLEKAFVSTHPLLDSWDRFAELLEVYVVRRGKMVFVRPFDEVVQHDRGSGKAGAMFEKINGIRAAAASLLNDVHSKVKLADQKKTRKSSPLVLEDSCFDFGTVLRNQVEEIRASARSGCHKGARHEPTYGFSPFNRGLMEFIKASRLPIWLVYATAIEQSIYEIVGSEPGLASDHYLDAVDQMSNDFALHQRAATQAIGPLAQRMQSHFSCRDVMEQDFRSSTAEDQVPAPRKPIAHFMGTPTAALDRLFEAVLDASKSRCEVANLSTMVIPIAHIYSAGRKLGLLPSPWQDMETFIDRHGSQIFLSNDSTHDSHTSLQRLIQALGLPSWHFHPGQLPALPSQRQIIERCKSIQPTSQLLELSHSNSDGFSKTEKIVKGFAKGQDRKPDAVPVDQGSSPANPTVQILASLKVVMEAEEPLLNFDYLELIEKCWWIGMYIGLEWDDRWAENADMCVRLAYTSLDSLDTARREGSPIQGTTLAHACEEIRSLIADSRSGIADELTQASKVVLGREACKRLRAYDPKHPGGAFEAYLKAKGKNLSAFSAQIIDSSAAGLTFWAPKAKEEEIDELAELGEKFWQAWEKDSSLRNAGLIEKRESSETTKNES